MAQLNLDDYITVAERIIEFYKRFPDGRTQTEIIDNDPDYKWVITKSYAYRTADDPLPVGHAHEWREKSVVSKTALLENAETSSVGRALAMLGIELSKAIASREEVIRAKEREAEMNKADAIKVEPEEVEDYKVKKELFESIKSLHIQLGAKNNADKLALLKKSGVASSFEGLTVDQLSEYAEFLKTQFGSGEKSDGDDAE